MPEQKKVENSWQRYRVLMSSLRRKGKYLFELRRNGYGGATCRMPSGVTVGSR
ncbi:hypothetical protein V2J09_008649 [Rumex salicifolius]